MVELYSIASNVGSFTWLVRVYEREEFLRLVFCKERRVQKLRNPVHLMRIGDIERHLQIFIRILDDDKGIAVNIRIFPFAFEENDATLLHFSRAKTGALEMFYNVGIGQRLRDRGFCYFSFSGGEAGKR